MYILLLMFFQESDLLFFLQSQREEDHELPSEGLSPVAGFFHPLLSVLLYLYPYIEQMFLII